MAPKEPTRAQLSSRLSYSQHTPTFLRRLQNKYSGNYDHDDEGEEEEEEGQYGGNHEFEDFDRGSGRPPIPRRPAIPERPPEDPGSADEDDEDEKPQVIVLKEGKHLTEHEAENIRRKGQSKHPSIGLSVFLTVRVRFCACLSCRRASVSNEISS